MAIDQKSNVSKGSRNHVPKSTSFPNLVESQEQVDTSRYLHNHNMEEPRDKSNDSLFNKKGQKDYKYFVPQVYQQRIVGRDMKVYTERQHRQSKITSIISRCASPGPVHHDKVCPTCKRSWPQLSFGQTNLNEEYIEDLNQRGEKRQKTSFGPVQSDIDAIKREL